MKESTKKTSFTAAPGIYLVEEIKEQSSVNLGKPHDRKLLKGKIISVGEDRFHDAGGKMISTFKVGDVIRFLNYQESYDNFEEDGKRIYTVLFNDVRAKYE